MICGPNATNVVEDTGLKTMAQGVHSAVAYDTQRIDVGRRKTLNIITPLLTTLRCWSMMKRPHSQN